MPLAYLPLTSAGVAPLAGAWIEMYCKSVILSKVQVAPLAGAWIEMYDGEKQSDFGLCRTPRGCVD